MADCDFSNLESLLTEARKYAVPTKEPTLFAVGGRGYYENPASDLLAFFLKPDADHGLGDLFLSTFLECMGADHRQLDLNHIDIKREERTANQNRIDLQILGTDWCLLIENKIYHWQANPFQDYEHHAKSLHKRKMLFSVLSPNGHSEAIGWSGVSYKEYCHALREKMDTMFFNSPFSKWQLFAQEFILHLENELYTPPMTSEQASFVERHATALIEAQDLLQEYPGYLCFVVKDELGNRLHYPVEVTASWAIIIKSPERWGNAYVALRPPTEVDRGDRSPESKFDLSIYPEMGTLREGQAEAGQGDLVKGMKHLAKHNCWVTVNGFSDRSEAIEYLTPRIKLIERIPSP
jgi:hypothetical protein